jgi:putative flippase GtrA
MKSQFIRFLIGGGVNTAVTYVLFLILSAFIHHTAAYSIVYVVGIALSYVINVKLVFRSAPSARSIVTYPVAYGVQYIYGLAALSLLIDYFSLDHSLAMLIVIGTSVPLTFILTRTLLTTRERVNVQWPSGRNVSTPLEASCDTMKRCAPSESDALLSRGNDARQ